MVVASVVIMTEIGGGQIPPVYVRVTKIGVYVRVLNTVADPGGGEHAP
jgi:hypothetical protein